MHGVLDDGNARGVSDHAPLELSIRERTPRQIALPVPREVLDSEVFREYAPLYASLAAPSAGLSAAERWLDVKAAWRTAGDVASGELRETADEDLSTEDAVLRSASRAVMRADAWLERRLVARSRVAQEASVVEGGRVRLRDGVAFEEKFVAACVAASESHASVARAGGKALGFGAGGCGRGGPGRGTR